MKNVLRIGQSKKFLVKNFAIAFRSFSPNLFMPIFVMALVCTCVCIPQSFAQELGDVVSPLIEASCLDCHADGSDTGLDLESLKFELSDRHAFETWVKVFDRAGSGQMPPESEDRPDPKLLNAAIAGLQKNFLLPIENLSFNQGVFLQSG